MKPCPFCAEDIQDKAIKCRYCGEFLEPSLAPQSPKASVWHQTTTAIVISLLTVGPLALPLVWLKPEYSLLTKLLVTVGVIALTIACFYATVAMYAHLLKQFEALGI